MAERPPSPFTNLRRELASPQVNASVSLSGEGAASRGNRLEPTPAVAEGIRAKSSHAAAPLHPLVVVRDEGPEQIVTVARGQPPELRAGPGFCVYERWRDAAGKDIEEFVTVIPAAEPTLYAVSDEQLNTWKGKRLIAKPMHLE